MAYALTTCAPGASNLTAKNRVWGIFANPNKSRPENRRQPQQPRRKNRPTATKTASGIPYWPSRDPIGERGGVNVYGFVNNDGLNGIDRLGMREQSVDDCIIYLRYEHGTKDKGKTINYKFKPGGCESRAGQIGCYPASNNPPIQNIPNIPTHDDGMAVMNGPVDTAILDRNVLNEGNAPLGAPLGAPTPPDREYGMPIALDNATSNENIRQMMDDLCKCCKKVQVVIDVDDNTKGGMADVLDGVNNHSKRFAGRLKHGKNRFDLRCSDPSPSLDP